MMAARRLEGLTLFSDGVVTITVKAGMLLRSQFQVRRECFDIEDDISFQLRDHQ